MKMKITPTSMKSLAVLALGSLSAAAQEAPDPSIHGDPYVPVGSLRVNPIFVQTGVKPNLDWGIEFPTIFNDLATVAPTGALVTSTTEEVTAEIRVDGISNDCDPESTAEREVVLWVRVGGEGSYWVVLFNGDKSLLDPSKVLLRQSVPPGTHIDVAARAKSRSGSWYPIVWTLEDSLQMVHLANGDTLPDYILPKFSTEELKSYTTAVLSDDNMTAETGPKDLVYMFELQSGDPSDPCFDLQDMVVTIQLQTFNNNGHGNNYDGVDVTNPGEGVFATVEDPSGSVDDEMVKGLGTLKQ